MYFFINIIYEAYVLDLPDTPIAALMTQPRDFMESWNGLKWLTPSLECGIQPGSYPNYT